MEAPSDSDEEDEFIYNPLKLPLGYDGKPIPYWLYKLHGLNQVCILPLLFCCQRTAVLLCRLSKTAYSFSGI